MSKTWQFRYAAHEGVTVVYPSGLPRNLTSSTSYPSVKFATISIGKNPIQVIYPITTLEDLDPKAIETTKDEILVVLRDQNPPASNSILNGIVRGLGLDNDWAAYKAAYAQKLLPFLEQKGLKVARNLLAPNFDGIVNLCHRNVADRMFASERPKLKRLFTGVGVDYWHLLELACAHGDLTIVNLFNQKHPILPPFDHHIPPRQLCH